MASDFFLVAVHRGSFERSSLPCVVLRVFRPAAGPRMSPIRAAKALTFIFFRQSAQRTATEWADQIQNRRDLSGSEWVYSSYSGRHSPSNESHLLLQEQLWFHVGCLFIRDRGLPLLLSLCCRNRGDCSVRPILPEPSSRDDMRSLTPFWRVPFARGSESAHNSLNANREKA